MSAAGRDITGQTFGRLTAVAYDDQRPSEGRWVFICECGTIKSVSKGGVTAGKVRSCGCLHRERCRSGLNQTVHGDAKNGAVTRLHGIWRGMLKRCRPTAYYGLRGISVCAEWKDYVAFKQWAIDSGYADDLTIDRIDNDGDYSPANCRWADRTAQARNRRTSRHVTIDGRTQVIAAWLEETGVTRSAFYGRIKRGWSERAALFPAQVASYA